MAYETIFRCRNEGEFFYPKERSAADDLARKKIGRNLERGVCFAMSVRWCKSMIQLGEVKNVDSIGNKGTFEMIQVAFEKGHASKGATERARMAKIVSAQGMEDLDYRESGSMRTILQYVADNPGYWIGGIGKPGEGAHQIAFKTEAQNAYYFDSNYGCVKFDNKDQFRRKVYDWTVKSPGCDYPEFAGAGAWRDAMKVALAIA